ncbi:MAG: hypothetical protein WAX04_11370 [Oscillospiraceae bacterium]
MKEENRSDPKYVEKKVKAMRRAVFYFYVYLLLGFATTVLLLFLFKRSAIPILVAFLGDYIILSIYLRLLYLRCPVCNKIFLSRFYFFENLACGGCFVPHECKCCGANLDYYNN